jgi:hypothetical protein
VTVGLLDVRKPTEMEVIALAASESVK